MAHQNRDRERRAGLHFRGKGGDIEKHGQALVL